MAQVVSRPLILVMLAGGGFLFETECLLAGIADDLDFVYLRTYYGGTPGEHSIPHGECHLVRSFASVTQKSLRASIQAFLSTFWTTFGLLRHRPVDAVLCIGCAHAVPMLLAACLLAKRTIFIETVSRTDQLSVTGKLVYYLHLARIFVVQWPDLQSRYPSARLGSIL
jgi:UDP-N-acetylglucosamine:LPS N-acetylglucosamine transferase